MGNGHTREGGRPKITKEQEHSEHLSAKLAMQSIASQGIIKLEGHALQALLDPLIVYSKALVHGSDGKPVADHIEAAWFTAQSFQPIQCIDEGDSTTTFGIKSCKQNMSALVRHVKII